jgi:Prokaryotic phospholipase A2
MRLQFSLSIVLLLTLSSAFPQPLITRTSQDACDLNGVYRIMNSSLIEFMDIFLSPDRPDCYHWCTNGCSKSPDSWLGACARHDFSWHNLKKFSAFDQGNKLNADEHLRAGIKELCGKHDTCGSEVAGLYYHAVRLANEPASEYNTWGPKELAKKMDCTIFPGCCSNHSDANKCGEERLPGQFKGDQSCVARS